MSTTVLYYTVLGLERVMIPVQKKRVRRSETMKTRVLGS